MNGKNNMKNKDEILNKLIGFSQHLGFYPDGSKFKNKIDWDPNLDEEHNIDFLRKCDIEYFNADDVSDIPSDKLDIPDHHYDSIKLLLQELYPNNPYFFTIGAPVEYGQDIKLPVSLGSLDQKYNDNDLENWIKRYNLRNKLAIATEKLDGFSCLLVYMHSKLVAAYSRGDGIVGKSVLHNVLHITSIPKYINEKSTLYVRGEIILDPKIFEQKYSLEYKNPRNFVSGRMNRKEPEVKSLKDLSFIAHELVNNYTLTKLESLKLLDIYFDIPNYLEIEINTAENFNINKFSSLIEEFKKKSKYELDGVVITVNDLQNLEEISKSQSLNPEHSIKVKLAVNESAITDVVTVHYEASKNNLLKPQIEIVPVDLNGVTIKFITGNNLRFIVDNGIGPGAKIEVIRAGDVIPKCHKVIIPVSPKYPDEFDWEWNVNHLNENVEAVLKDKNSPEVVFKQVLDFFTSLEVELLKEASLKAIIDAYEMQKNSYDAIIDTIFDMMEHEFVKIIGANGLKIYQSLQRKLSNLTYPIIVGSYNAFGVGFGIRKAKKLFEQISISDLLQLQATKHTTAIEIISKLEGFDEKTATNIFNGLDRLQTFLTKHADRFTFKTEEISSDLKGISVVLTGFRDSEFQSRIEKMGAKVSTSVSKKTTYVIAANPSEVSGKITKAKELNIPVITLEIFKDKHNL